MALYFIMYNVCKYLWNTKSSKPKKNLTDVFLNINNKIIIKLSFGL